MTQKFSSGVFTSKNEELCSHKNLYATVCRISSLFLFTPNWKQPKYSWNLSYLVFSKIPRSVVCCLTLIWGSSQSLVLQIFLLLFLSLFWYVTLFIVVTQFLDILFHFLSLFSLCFSFGNFC